jgi:hypothetical protein
MLSSRGTCNCVPRTLCAGTVCRCQQGAVHGHGLRRVFDATGGTESAVSAQRVVGGAVAAGATLDALLIPCLNRFEQAHAPLMRDVVGNPGVVEFGLI